MKILAIIITAFLLSQSAFSALVKSNDTQNNCSLYQVISADENGEIHPTDDQVVLSMQNLYGLSFTDMEIDFNKQIVRVQATANVLLGFNHPLLPNKVIIEKNNPNFNFLINQLNRKILLFEKMCISNDNKVVYANYFEVKEEPVPNK